MEGRGLNPTLAAMKGPWASPSLAVACITLCGNSCNNLLSSVHTVSVIYTVSVAVWNIKNTKLLLL